MTETSAIIIADKAFAILSDALRDQFTTFRRTPMLSVQPADLPILGVYILRERRTPDGDANAGVPKFIHQMTMGLSGAVSIESDEENRLMELEAVMTQIDDLLLTNPQFVMLSEGVLGMDRTSQYAKVGEVSLGEIRVEMTFQYRSSYEPVIPDKYLTLHVTTEYPSPASSDSDIQIVREYDIPQN